MMIRMLFPLILAGVVTSSLPALAQDQKQELAALMRLSALSDVCPLSTSADEEEALEDEINEVGDDLGLKDADLEAMFQATRKDVDQQKVALCAAEGPAALAAIKKLARE